VIVILESDPGYPFALGLIFDRDSETRDYFYSLPEETQLALINEDIHSSEELHDRVEKMKLKR
jgi:hypothetical protein